MASKYKSYSIVDFAPLKINDVKWSDLVASDWIRKEEGQLFCYWPPNSISNKAKAVKRMMPPSKNWQEYLVERVVVSYGKLYIRVGRVV